MVLKRASSVPLLSRLGSADDERARRLELQSECDRLQREGEVIAAELAATRSAIGSFREREAATDRDTPAGRAGAVPAHATGLPRQPTVHVELELRIVGGAWDGHESGVCVCARARASHFPPSRLFPVQN